MCTHNGNQTHVSLIVRVINLCYKLKYISCIDTQKNTLPCCKLVHQESDELHDTRNLRDEDLKTLAHVSLHKLNMLWVKYLFEYFVLCI